jgi:hypothetical protein
MLADAGRLCSGCCDFQSPDADCSHGSRATQFSMEAFVPGEIAGDDEVSQNNRGIERISSGWAPGGRPAMNVTHRANLAAASRRATLDRGTLCCCDIQHGSPPGHHHSSLRRLVKRVGHRTRGTMRPARVQWEGFGTRMREGARRTRRKPRAAPSFASFVGLRAFVVQTPALSAAGPPGDECHASRQSRRGQSPGYMGRGDVLLARTLSTANVTLQKRFMSGRPSATRLTFHPKCRPTV